MRSTLLIALLASTWASTAHALDLENLALGASLPSVMQSLRQSGVTLIPNPSSANASRAVFLLSSDRPAQFEFCRGILVRVTETIGGGMQGFLSRSETETRRLGLSQPHLEQETGRGEITFSEWILPAGGHLTVAWTVDEVGALGTVTRDRPCEPKQEEAASVVAAPPPAPPSSVVALTPVPPAAAVSVDVKVPLPDVDPQLVVDDVVASSPVAHAPVVAVPAAAAPAVVVPATPEPLRQEALRPETTTSPRNAAARLNAPQNDATAAVRRRTAVQPPNNAQISAHPRARPTKPAPAATFPARHPETVQIEPTVLPQADVTNTIGPADPAVDTEEGVKPSNPGIAAPPAPRVAQNQELTRTWRPNSQVGCARAFRSYDAKTHTYRTVSGQVLTCP